VLDQEASILGENGFMGLHPSDHDLGEFGFALMTLAPDLLEAADAKQELADVLGTTPFAIADNVQTGQLL
jgi:hypothetical protein